MSLFGRHLQMNHIIGDGWHGHLFFWYNNLVKKRMQKEDEEQKCSEYCVIAIVLWLPA